MTSEFIEWKYCAGPCGELKDESQFPKTKRNGRVIHVSKVCKRCLAKKYAPAKAEKKKSKFFRQEVKERLFVSMCNPVLHPYLKKYGQA